MHVAAVAAYDFSLMCATITISYEMKGKNVILI